MNVKKYLNKAIKKEFDKQQKKMIDCIFDGIEEMIKKKAVLRDLIFST